MNERACIKKKKLINDNGMSLIEVLIAIIILSVSLMAFFTTFTASALYDKDARDKQRALNVAEGFMEGFKAYNIDEIYVQYQDPDPNNFKLYTGTFSNRFCLPADCYDWTLADFSRASGNVYTFGADVEYDGETYSVVTTVTPRAAAALEDNRSVTDLHNKYEDAYCRLKKDMIQKVYEDAANQLRAAGFVGDINASTVEPGHIKILSKVNALNITGSQINAQVSCTTTYVYKFDNYVFTTDTGTATLNTQHTITIGPAEDADYNFYDNSATGNSKLRNVYVYFFPDWSTSSAYRETFEVRCSFDEELHLFMLKQYDSNLSSMALTEQESNYKPIVKKLGANGNIYIHQNILERLDSTGHPSPCQVTDISGFANNGILVYGKSNIMDADPDEHDIPLVYDVTVSVFDSASNLVYELNGSKNSD